MRDLQGVVTGAIYAHLLNESLLGSLDADVMQIMDGNQASGQIIVTDRETGDTLLVVVMTEADRVSFPPNHPPTLREVPPE